MRFKIISITAEYIKQFNIAVDAVARERKYLAFLTGPSMDMSTAFVQENIKGNWPHVVAIAENKVVGWCDITSIHRDVAEHVGSLGIGVIEGYRGIGIGEELMHAALQLAKDRGLTRIELTVRENNTRAIELYKKLGFSAEGLHRNAIRIDGKYENYISMALLLNY